MLFRTVRHFIDKMVIFTKYLGDLNGIDFHKLTWQFISCWDDFRQNVNNLWQRQNGLFIFFNMSADSNTNTCDTDSESTHKQIFMIMN